MILPTWKRKFREQASCFSFPALGHIFLQQIKPHTNSQHENKTSSSSNPKKEELFCILQSNSWLVLGGSGA